MAQRQSPFFGLPKDLLLIAGCFFSAVPLSPALLAATLQTTVNCASQRVTVKNVSGPNPAEIITQVVNAEYPAAEQDCITVHPVLMDIRTLTIPLGSEVNIDLLQPSNCNVYIISARSHLASDENDMSEASCASASAESVLEIVAPPVNPNLVHNNIIDLQATGVNPPEGCMGPTEYLSQVKNGTSSNFTLTIDSKYICQQASASQTTPNPCDSTPNPPGIGWNRGFETVQNFAPNQCFSVDLLHAGNGSRELPTCCDLETGDTGTSFMVLCSWYAMTQQITPDGFVAFQPALLSSQKSDTDSDPGIPVTFGCKDFFPDNHSSLPAVGCNTDDMDLDTLVDPCDVDVDGDGVGNSGDNCRNRHNPPPQGDQDGDAATCTDPLFNTHLDFGCGDLCDNCPSVPNPTQANSDTDSFGNACDKCWTVSNGSQTDTDGDCSSIPVPYSTDPLCGDSCDSDIDGDGDPNSQDNCPTVSNANQANQDAGSGDTFGNACDNCRTVLNNDQLDSEPDCPPFPFSGSDPKCGDVCDTNDDLDSFNDSGDNCRLVTNQDQLNSDGDSAGDACDNCPSQTNDQSSDFDGDGVGDACDRCRFGVNPGQEDVDSDCPLPPPTGFTLDPGCGDACDELTPEFATTAGGTIVTIHHDQADTLNPPNDSVTFGGVPGSNLFIPPAPAVDTLLVESPSSQTEADVPVDLVSGGMTIIATLVQPFGFDSFGYVSREGGITGLDTARSPVSGSASLVPISGFPASGTFSALDSGFRFGAGGIEEELTVLGKVERLDGTTQWRLYAVDLGRNQPTNPDFSLGLLPLPARAIATIDDNPLTEASENRYAFVPLAPDAVFGELVGVDLGVSPPQVFSTLQAPATIPGAALEIVLKHQTVLGQQRLYAYVTSDANNLATVPDSLGGGGGSPMLPLSGESGGDEPIPIPWDEGGGDPPIFRKLYLSVFDVTPPSFPGTQLEQFTVSVSAFLTDEVPALEHMGLAFVPGTDLLYVVGPDRDEAFVFATSTSPITLVAQFPVGDKPSDVVVVEANVAEQDKLRAYITNTLGNSVTVRRVSDFSLFGTFPLPLGQSEPIAIAVRSDGTRAYAVNGGANKVSVMSLSDNAFDLVGIPLDSIGRRLLIQK